MPQLATADATRAYAARFFARTAAGHFRNCGGLLFSSIGMGTYLGEPDAATDLAYTEAAIEAVMGGINVLDSAINYRFQRSERSIGAALAQLAARGIPREAVVLCTKGGYLTPDGAVPANAKEYFQREYMATGVLRAQDVAAGCHSMTPPFLDNQLTRSLRNLGVESVDVYYLHNPETQLEVVPREEFRKRLRAAFGFCESAAAEGRIGAYGLATWNGFRQAPDSAELLVLEDAVEVAREVAGEAHHFRFIQLPFNLMMPEALLLPNQPLGGRQIPLLAAAMELGITVVGSASLLQGRLSSGLPPILHEVIGLDSDAHRAAQFARSAPGLTTALLGMSRASHVREILELFAAEPLPEEEFWGLFQRE
jgi:aryl-alcohol dehydrogenase-like predicted oxidoreductase